MVNCEGSDPIERVLDHLYFANNLWFTVTVVSVDGNDNKGVGLSLECSSGVLEMGGFQGDADFHGFFVMHCSLL